MVASKLLLAIATIGLALPAWAARAPIVFDFEDGLQGWGHGGSAQRVQTQVLGGDWAIFGDDVGAFIWIEIDLTGIAIVSVEQFLSNASLGTNFLRIVVTPIGGGIGIGTSLSDTPDPAANPGIRLRDLRFFEGLHHVSINWAGRSPAITPGFIDNITFHPVPEPSTWLYLSLGIAGMVMIRSKLASGA